MTGDLNKRIEEHINKINPQCFSSKYNLNKLIHIEEYPDVKDAIQREKKLKTWNRAWKDDLINTNTPIIGETLKERSPIGVGDDTQSKDFKTLKTNKSEGTRNTLSLLF